MKRFFILFFFFLFSSVSHSSESIPSDDCFSLSMWLDIQTYNSLVNKNVFKVENVLGGYGAQFCCDASQPISFYISSSIAWEQFISPNLSSGNHLLTVSYCSSSPYQQVGGLSDPSVYSKVYFDGVLAPLNWTAGILPSNVSGVVTLGSMVVPDSFVYSPDVLTTSQIQQLKDFGVPGTIKYQVNILFWEVIKHFRFFF